MRSRSKKKAWKDLNALQRAGVVVMGGAQIALFVAAQKDISQRSDAEIQGNRWAWRAACLINFVGPVSYFLFGRRPNKR
ncbi:PLDc N-terminal domain-containing protein [Pseudarthrobacter sp. J1763]|uniref:PLDc N-terminal domain-containing protein n=1 Tax=Pseudarthrobacter sp. J1763 TaxID=3420445 RepID=UPI003D284D63